MATDIVVPALGESVTEATVAKWLKQVGDKVAVDEPLLELETDKVSLEVYAAKAGTLSEIRAKTGDTVEVGAVVGVIGDGAAASAAAHTAVATGPEPIQPAAKPAAPALQAVPQAAALSPETVQPAPPTEAPPVASQPDRLAPAVRKLVEENKLVPDQIPATGKTGRLTKTDVLGYLEREGRLAAPVQTPTTGAPPAAAPASAPAAPAAAASREERVRMTRLRKRIAERLKQAQNNAAMLTTFNEVDMTNLLAVRNHYKDAFEKKHGVKLGFMSFFVKACIVALKEIPAVNGEIDGEDIVYKNHYDVGVAVGTEQGLVVPVVRDADQMTFAAIEAKITELGRKARDGKLTIEELTGGTFTISNGGVYGSLLSTPILNPPQSGILGMHKIQPRPIAIGDKVDVRPMMYLALSYDHRIIDGREAVTFLVRVKECIEDPQRILLDM